MKRLALLLLLAGCATARPDTVRMDRPSWDRPHTRASRDAVRKPLTVPSPRRRTVSVSHIGLAHTTAVRRSGSVWDLLAECESGGDWSYNGPSGFDGGLQFLPSTWAAYRHAGEPLYAWQASRDVQIRVAQRLQAADGWTPWPACSRKLGLR